jgi:uncharacterized protein (TIGR02284 family)
MRSSADQFGWQSASAAGMTKEEQLQHLHDLIAVAKDSELGYRTAAEHVDDPHLAGIFSQYATQRAGFVEDLTAEAARITGELPSESGSVMGAVFRGWMNLKSALTGGGAEAIVAACETGEDSAQAAYERVVNMDVSGKMRSLVEAQWNKIKEAHQRMLHLKEQLLV